MTGPVSVVGLLLCSSNKTMSTLSNTMDSYSPGNSRKRDENNLAKWLGFPHLQDTLDGPGRPKSLPQIGLSGLT